MEHWYLYGMVPCGRQDLILNHSDRWRPYGSQDKYISLMTAFEPAFWELTEGTWIKMEAKAYNKNVNMYQKKENTLVTNTNSIGIIYIHCNLW